jgi:(E)-4-hydroxy-3-methylbut-2-enyl-diphosphate synthase
MKRKTRQIKIGTMKIGSNNPVIVQSMTKTKTHNIKATVQQIKRLEKAGCEIVRLAVVDRKDSAALGRIRNAVSIPLIADIHFDYRLAIQAIDAGIDKIRINPGNIAESWKITRIIEKAKDAGIPIRLGVNSGSLPKKILRKYKHPTPEAIVETIKNSLVIFKKQRFENIVLSAKGADVMTTIAVYKKLHELFVYPLHLGITEAGLPFRGGLRSAVGLGILLNEGIGDTIRISLTADPVMEVVAAYEILDSLGLRQHNPVLISCPTCGRCDVKLTKIVNAVERRLQHYNSYMKVAVMGCVVNGPGEAREADFGIACGKKTGLIFAKGEEVKRVKEELLVSELFEVIDENIDN